MNDMKAITLKQLNEWLNKNKGYTWFLGEGGGFQPENRPLIKYFDFVLDTRTMEVFCIKFRLLDTEMVLSTANQSLNETVLANNFETILDYLDYEINKVKLVGRY